jgi:hypothetical protein
VIKGPSKEAKHDLTTARARAIIDTERKKRDAKTARLKEARLRKEAADAEEPGHKRAE